MRIANKMEMEVTEQNLGQDVFGLPQRHPVPATWNSDVMAGTSAIILGHEANLRQEDKDD